MLPVLALVVAALSFGTSALTAWHNVIVERDDLQVVVGGASLLQALDDTTVLVRKEVSLSFFNLGNRSAAVTSVNLLVNSKADGTGVCGIEVPPLHLSISQMLFEMEPFVIKAGDVSNVTIKLQSDVGDDMVVWRKFTLPALARARLPGGAPMRACLQVLGSTPRSAFRGVAASWDINNNRGALRFVDRESPGKANIVVQQSWPW